MQDNDDGCGGVTCNDEGVGDGCPSDPAKDARDPDHDTQRTWTRRMDQGACNACAVAYDRAIGYPYKLGDSNGAVMDCIRAAQAAGMPGRRPSYFRLRQFVRPTFRAGRYYIQGLGKSPEERCTDALRAPGGCAGLAQSGCPNICGQATRGSQTVHLVSLGVRPRLQPIDELLAAGSAVRHDLERLRTGELRELLRPV